MRQGHGLDEWVQWEHMGGVQARTRRWWLGVQEDDGYAEGRGQGRASKRRREGWGQRVDQMTCLLHIKQPPCWNP